MNRVRRKELRDILRNLDGQLNWLREVAAEEEEYRDNMPENLMGSEKYDRAEEAANLLNEAADSLESAIDEIRDQISDAMA